MGRQEILKELENIIYEAMERCLASNYRNTTNTRVNPHKLRQGYYNSLATLIKAYNQLLKDSEIDEIKEEIEELKEELIQ